MGRNLSDIPSAFPPLHQTQLALYYVRIDRTFRLDFLFIFSMYTDIEEFPSKSDRFLVRVSYLEIYNEKISDLMVRKCYVFMAGIGLRDLGR